ncbi:MAG: glycosyltransferase family 4 protein [Actinomycetes bacterium]
MVFRYVHHYRAGFYERLRVLLRDRGVELRLLVGRPGPRDQARRDAVTIPWATPIDTRYVSLGRRELCWQSCLSATWDADLVVVEQASRLLANYVLLARRAFGGPRVAMWGHGENIQPHRADHLGERVKQVMSRRADWWFAYNETSAAVVRGFGFPVERTTVVQNAIDTSGLRTMQSQLDPTDIQDARARWAVKGRHVGVFSGSLYPDKRLRFLIAAADRVRAVVPDFELLVIGAGPDEPFVRSAADSRTWLHPLGALYGRDKVLAFSLCQAYLVPGLVGLGILDGFALGLPLVTTRVPFHSHEIEYLTDGVDGVMVDDWRDPQEYARAIVRVMTDPDLQLRLKAGCAAAGRRYTIEAMSDRFAAGVCQAIQAPKRRA